MTTDGRRYPIQIERFDSKESLLEICEAFGIGKIKIGFRKYNSGAEKGNRVTADADIFFSMNEALLLSRFILNGGVGKKIAEIEQNARMTGQAPNWGMPLWESGPHGNPKRQPVMCSYLKVFRSSSKNSAIAVAALKGPGKVMTDYKGGLQMDGAPTTKIFIPLSMDNAKAFAMALERCVRMYDTALLLDHYGLARVTEEGRY